jgi:hypothetical protein
MQRKANRKSLIDTASHSKTLFPERVKRDDPVPRFLSGRAVPVEANMLRDGDYIVWFKTPLGTGTGRVRLEGGTISGADSIISYGGSYAVDGDRFCVRLQTWRHSDGHGSLLGFDNAELVLEGNAHGDIASCSGPINSSGAMLEVTLIPVRGDAPREPSAYRPEDFHPERLPKGLPRR